MNALSLKDIRFSYDCRRRILDGVTLDIEQGAAVAVTGRSGCGKSTLAMIACGVIPKSLQGDFSGSVSVFGEDISDKQIYETARHISMVFQDPESQLFAPAVVDEVAFAPENLCYERESIISSVDSALDTVGMRRFSDYSPNMLSGGQQQLTALASILSLDPGVIILDEVTAQIDEAGVLLIREAVKKLKAQGKALMIIEHGETLRDLCDTVYSIENGRISMLGSPASRET
jgi:energy-coupling factor transporter ATP-binding protein EcfA2